MRSVSVFLCLTFAGLAAWAQSPKVEENVQYGAPDDTKLLLDVYEPADTSVPHPAVILIHGGSWTSLDKSTMARMAGLLAREGFVGFAVDYRLFDGKHNTWPAQLDDVQRAVRWVRANAAKYNVQPDHIGAFGHSAGAQLAALLGMEETRDNSDPALAKYSSKVQAVVDVSGPTDFNRDHDADGDAFFAKFLKHQPLSDGSPVDHVTKTTAPFLIVHGTRDESVPIAQSQELVDKLKENGVPVKFVKVDDVHTFQTQEARRELAIDTIAFFERYLMPGQ